MSVKCYTSLLLAGVLATGLLATNVLAAESEPDKKFYTESTEIVDNTGEFHECAFQDVMPGHAYHDAIEDLHGRKIVSGVSDGLYLPDARINLKSLSAMCIRAFAGLDEGDFPEDIQDFMAKRHYIHAGRTDDEFRSFLPDFQTGVGIIMRAAGILPARDPMFYTGYTDADAYSCVANVMAELDIADIRDRTWHDGMTRGDAAYLIHAILEWQEGRAGEFKPDDVTLFNYIDLSATEKFQKYIPEAYGDLTKLPFNILKAYHDNGFKIVLDDEYIRNYMKEKGVNNTVALFSRSKKTIWSRVGNSMLHEMGHFTQAVVMNDRVSITDYYKVESGAAKKAVSLYSITDTGEFFAECFEHYFRTKADEKKASDFRMAMPRTYQYLQDLDSAGFVTEKTDFDAYVIPVSKAVTKF